MPLGTRSSLHLGQGRSTINHNCLSGYVCRQIRRQEKHGTGNILCGAESSQRHSTGDAIVDLTVAEIVHGRRRNHPWLDTIDAYTVAASSSAALRIKPLTPAF